nr:hypothetical protein [Tanacetum cinerariifolium]
MDHFTQLLAGLVLGSVAGLVTDLVLGSIAGLAASSVFGCGGPGGWLRERCCYGDDENWPPMVVCVIVAWCSGGSIRRYSGGLDGCVAVVMTAVVDPIHQRNIKWYQSLVRCFDQEKNNSQAQQKKKMVKTSSSSENKPCCSKSCKKNTDSLNSKITELTNKLGDRENLLFHYKAKGLDSKLAGFQTASKDLDSLLESQRLDKNKEGLGYSAVLPPPAQVYSPPKKDMSWTGLPEFADDTITDYSRPSLAIESTLDDLQNKNPSVTENGALDSILSKPVLKFVKAVDKPAERPKTNKVETVKKPATKYAEMYRRTSKQVNTARPKAVINRRNWVNDVKASACWVWKPVKPNSTSIILKRYDYVDVMAAPTISVSTEENLRDQIDIRVDIIHLEPVAAVAFPAAVVVRTQAKHGEAIRGIHEQLLGVPIQEELTPLRFRLDIAETENASLRARIKTTKAIKKITRKREKHACIEIEQQLATV